MAEKVFNDVPAQFDFPAEEQRIRAFWEAQRIYEKSLERRRGGPPFVFYEGPPTANGLPHPGHCLTRAIKDLFPRYKTMCGYYCERKAGWDTHGLPVEVEVCKELGIHSKEEIEKFGVEPFIHKCMESVFRYTKEWEEVTRRLGFWVNLEEAYVTYHQSYVESVWWALKTLFDAGLLYQGHKIVWWWAQGGTALSSGEVGQGYREVDDPSVYVRFPLVEDERFRALFRDFQSRDREGAVQGAPGSPEPLPDGRGSEKHPRVSLLVWTTTPWTLPSNMFAAVHKDIEYAVVLDEKSGERLIFAAALVEQIAKKAKAEGWKVERTVKGEELIYLRYVPPFDCYYRDFGNKKLFMGGAKVYGDLAWFIYLADFVSLESGTGAVHEAPAFGEVDYNLWQQIRAHIEVAKREEFPLLCAVAPDGKFTSEAPEKYRGRWVKDCDKDIIRDMKDRGLLLHQEQYRHDYPFCWRAEQDPLIQYPRKSWFIRTTQFKEDMLANNETISWLPEHIKQGRFGAFLRNNVDWALSRERYWGTPLPIWVCEKCGQMEAVDSWEHLMAKPGVAGVEVWENAKRQRPELSEHLKVHKPYIDAISYACPKCANQSRDREGAVHGASESLEPLPHGRGSEIRMRRVPDVIDCWFDSGAMPFAQWGYPHQPGSIERLSKLLPADFISEALDQTRGWFYSLVAISTLLFGKNGVAKNDRQGKNWPLPFRNCIVLGILNGEDGLKMSKSKKNYKEPGYIFDKEGADAMRWLLLSGQPPWTSIRFQESAIAEAQREFLIRLYNVYSFFVIYAKIDKWSPDQKATWARPPAVPFAAELDRWILSELNRTIRDVRASMDAYDNFTAARSINAFVDGLSNWYVRRCRERFWRSDMDADKNAAYSVLYNCLSQTTLLAAPFVPFFCESIYQNLVVEGTKARRHEGTEAEEPLESVHLCDYPQADAAMIDEKLSAEMAVVRDIVSLGRAARAESKIKVRQPLSLVEIVLADRSHTDWLRGHEALFCDELNVKQIEFTGEADHYVNYQVKPNFKAIGPKFGKLGPAIKQALAAASDPARMRREIDEGGRTTLTVGGQTIELTAEDVQIELSAKPGWAAAQNRTAVVVLKTEISDALRGEGLAREIVHHVQQIRKEMNLKYEQRIELGIVGDGEIAAVARGFADYICGETLATRAALEELPGVEAKAVDIEGHAVRLFIRAM